MDGSIASGLGARRVGICRSKVAVLKAGGSPDVGSFNKKSGVVVEPNVVGVWIDSS
ncbi:MAG: hypothetical protein ACYTGQ_03920 [Planctomycetota bacterium]|jgi:hypothetical protein